MVGPESGRRIRPQANRMQHRRAPAAADGDHPRRSAPAPARDAATAAAGFRRRCHRHDPAARLQCVRTDHRPRACAGRSRRSTTARRRQLRSAVRSPLNPDRRRHRHADPADDRPCAIAAAGRRRPRRPRRLPGWRAGGRVRRSAPAPASSATAAARSHRAGESPVRRCGPATGCRPRAPAPSAAWCPAILRFARRR
jgi:hypothetical protein